MQSATGCSISGDEMSYDVSSCLIVFHFIVGGGAKYHMMT